jgi:hypothetical protein
MIARPLRGGLALRVIITRKRGDQIALAGILKQNPGQLAQSFDNIILR